jgi:hypothetical protein
MILRHRGKAFDSNTNLPGIYRASMDRQKQAANGAAHFPQADFLSTYPGRYVPIANKHLKVPTSSPLFFGFSLRYVRSEQLGTYPGS